MNTTMKRTIKQEKTFSPMQARRRGAMAVLIAVCLPIFLIMAAFSIDVAYMELTRTELRISTDAAARAAGRTLSIAQDQDAAKTAGVAYALKNKVAGNGLVVALSDFEFGSSDQVNDTGRWVFTPNATPVNAVRVTGQRTAGSGSGPVNLFFAGVLGQPTYEPVKTAVSTQVDRDIVLVVDRSGSMAYAIWEESPYPWKPASAPWGWWYGDVAPPNARWYSLETAVSSFLTALDTTPQIEKVGLATFASTSRIDQNMTDTYSLINDEIDDITQDFWGGSTAVGYGMNDGITALTNATYARPFAAKTLVIMTDGIHNTGTTPLNYVQQAIDAGVTVHAITFSNEADTALMQQVATSSGGSYWHAPDEATLISVFNQIANNTPTLITE